MEAKFIFSDIIEMLKMIKDEPSRQEAVYHYLDKLVGKKAASSFTLDTDFSDIIPDNIMDRLLLIRHDEQKLMNTLNYIENIILKRNEDKSEQDVLNIYAGILPQVTEAVKNGFTVYLNPETLEMEQVQSSTLFNMKDIEEQNDDLLDEYELEYLKWNNYIRFEPFGTYDAEMLMENFIRQMNDKNLADRLETALTIQGSTDEFLNIVQNNKNAQKSWETYNKKATEEYIKNHLLEVVERYKKRKNLVADDLEF